MSTTHCEERTADTFCSMLGRETESHKQSPPYHCSMYMLLHQELLLTLSDIGSPVSMVEHQTACFWKNACAAPR